MLNKKVTSFDLQCVEWERRTRFPYSKLICKGLHIGNLLHEGAE